MTLPFSLQVAFNPTRNPKMTLVTVTISGLRMRYVLLLYSLSVHVFLYKFPLIH